MKKYSQLSSVMCLMRKYTVFTAGLVVKRSTEIYQTYKKFIYHPIMKYFYIHSIYPTVYIPSLVSHSSCIRHEGSSADQLPLGSPRHMGRGPWCLHRHRRPAALRGFLGGIKTMDRSALRVGWGFIASTGHHYLGFRTRDVRWAAHVLKRLQAGDGITWSNPSRAGIVHSGSLSLPRSLPAYARSDSFISYCIVRGILWIN